MIKLRQRVSGCLRTLTGAQQFYAIRSYLATAAKQRPHLLGHPRHLVMLAEGKPWIPAHQTPVLTDANAMSGPRSLFNDTPAVIEGDTWLARNQNLGLGEQVCHLTLWTGRSDPLAARLPGTDLPVAYCW